MSRIFSATKQVLYRYAFANKDTERLCRYTDQWDNRLMSYIDPDELSETISYHSYRTNRDTLRLRCMFIVKDSWLKGLYNNQTIRAVSSEKSDNTLGAYR